MFVKYKPALVRRWDPGGSIIDDDDADDSGAAGVANS